MPAPPPAPTRHAPAAAAGWDTPALADPHAAPDKPQRVRAMFASIAHRYDLNNRLHSLGLDRRWRRVAARAAGVGPGDRVLDAACGTGDLTLELARARPREVVGVDFTPEMLELARRKLAARPADPRTTVSFRAGDALALDFPDASFDAATIGFGLRNVAEPVRALAELARVLRPGGRVVVLEFTTPPGRLARWVNAVYCRRVMPVTATLIAHDRTGAYRYLPASVATFMDPPTVCAALRDAGFLEVAFRPLTLGICGCYRGVRGG
ncbi:MAG TPA: bifunctional demethylmenaquinone methyltransferase/2-methoxy-6-polyprenyl-1,4-benzoquinol methylase UbiE [Phycisphaerales bacterium]|nr:bifunctional demethylmenaquinone methyltransferase/2-methoxy-6-polyprenyl-1,4-benzoquinol methylase UbiE [Phycisphaerales bacterium]